VAEADGDVSLETFTVTYDRDGAAEQAIVVSRTPKGERVWANSQDPGVIETLVGAEVLGTAGRLSGGRFDFR